MKTSIVILISLLLFGCGKGGSGVGAFLCGDGHAKGKMTLGLNLDFFQGLGLTDSAISDDALRKYLNEGLASVSIGTNALNVSSIESIEAGDTVRFLELGGTFGAGFGVATKLFKQAFGGTSLTASDPFSFINESFNVSAAALRKDGEYYNPSFGALRDVNYSIKALQVGHEDQWAYAQTDYTSAMTLFDEMKANSTNSGSDPVIVAVLDTGVDLNHPDLKDIIIDGYDAVGSGSVQDENGHGTHCAGIIASQTKSATSPLGVATHANVKILPIKVLDAKGSGGFQAIEKGIRYATKFKDANGNGVDVISMSLGAGLEFSDVSKTDKALSNPVINEAIAAGIIVVVAAGNESCKLGGECKSAGMVFSKEFNVYTVVPCAYEGTICVGATDANETLASYSNYSSKKSESYRTKADVNAPGTAIYSTWPTNLDKSYNTISGTSMATPYVAGVAALLKSIDKTVTQEDVKKYLQSGQAYPSDVQTKSEAGRVDLYSTLVAFANEKNRHATPPQNFTPDEKPVEGPEVGGGNDGDALISALWSAVCNL